MFTNRMIGLVQIIDNLGPAERFGSLDGEQSYASLAIN